MGHDLQQHGSGFFIAGLFGRCKFILHFCQRICPLYGRRRLGHSDRHRGRFRVRQLGRLLQCSFGRLRGHSGVTGQQRFHTGSAELLQMLQQCSFGFGREACRQRQQHVAAVQPAASGFHLGPLLVLYQIVQPQPQHIGKTCRSHRRFGQQGPQKRQPAAAFGGKLLRLHRHDHGHSGLCRVG